MSWTAKRRAKIVTRLLIVSTLAIMALGVLVALAVALHLKR